MADDIWHQPIGEVLKKDLSVPDALKKEIHLDFFKKEIKPLGFLDKEITLRRKHEEIEPIETTTCAMCGNTTPSTVSKCLHCEATLAVQAKSPEPQIPAISFDSVSLIDQAEKVIKEPDNGSWIDKAENLL